MFKNKIKQNKGAINKEMLQRLDCVEVDSEYNPYEPTKKKEINTEEMFSDSIYDNDNTNEEGRGPLMAICMATVLTFIAIIVNIFKVLGVL